MIEGNGNAPIGAGGAGITKNFDMTTDKDRGTIRNLSERWPARWRGVSSEFKEQIVKDLSAASDTARVKLQSETEALGAANTLASIARTVVAMEAQQPADDHLQDKNARLDAGLATERLAVEPVILRKAINPQGELTDGT